MTSERTTEHRTEELRGNVTPTLLRLIDACAQSEGKGRMEWCAPILEAEARRRLHAATVLVRMAGVHPFQSDRGDE